VVAGARLGGGGRARLGGGGGSAAGLWRLTQNLTKRRGRGLTVAPGAGFGSEGGVRLCGGSGVA